jgi:hypothetical protein
MVIGQSVGYTNTNPEKKHGKIILIGKDFSENKAQKCIAILLNTIKHYCLECI